jgi:hypothetical protein
MKATAFLAGWCLVPIAAMFLSANAFAADPAEPSKPTAIEDMTTCELVLGKSIENVVLVDQRGRSVAFRRSGSSMFVMPGEYSIQEITLQGGYVARFLSGSSMNRITLIPDKPCQFDVRLPLTSAIAVTRAGRLLKLDYQLLDGDGRKYTRNAAGALSRFTIYQGDRKIGSGSFEYG